MSRQEPPSPVLVALDVRGLEGAVAIQDGPPPLLMVGCPTCGEPHPLRRHGERLGAYCPGCDVLGHMPGYAWTVLAADLTTDYSLPELIGEEEHQDFVDQEDELYQQAKQPSKEDNMSEWTNEYEGDPEEAAEDSIVCYGPDGEPVTWDQLVTEISVAAGREFKGNGESASAWYTMRVSLPEWMPGYTRMVVAERAYEYASSRAEENALNTLRAGAQTRSDGYELPARAVDNDELAARRQAEERQARTTQNAPPARTGPAPTLPPEGTWVEGDGLSGPLEVRRSYTKIGDMRDGDKWAIVATSWRQDSKGKVLFFDPEAYGGRNAVYSVTRTSKSYQKVFNGVAPDPSQGETTLEDPIVLEINVFRSQDGKLINYPANATRLSKVRKAEAPAQQAQPGNGNAWGSGSDEEDLPF